MKTKAGQGQMKIVLRMIYVKMKAVHEQMRVVLRRIRLKMEVVQEGQVVVAKAGATVQEAHIHQMREIRSQVNRCRHRILDLEFSALERVELCGLVVRHLHLGAHRRIF